MKRRNYNQAVLGGTAGIVLILAQIYGCSGGDDNDSPSKPPVVTGGASGSGGSGKGGSDKGGNGAGGDANGGDANSDGGTANTSGGTGNTGGDNGTGGAPPIDNGCEPEETGDGCWTCPEETLQYLNQCTNSQCSPFVNDKAHLPLLNDDGSLPDLP